MPNELSYEAITEDPKKLLAKASEYFSEAEQDYATNLEPRIVENYQHFHFTCDFLQERAALDGGGRASLYISDLYQIAETRADQTARRVRSSDPPIRISPLNPDEPGAQQGAVFQQKLYMAAIKELHDGGQGMSWDTRLKDHLWDIEIFPYGIIKAQLEKRLTLKTSYDGGYPSSRNGVRYRLPAFTQIPIWHFRKDPLASSQTTARYENEMWMLTIEEIRARYRKLTLAQIEDIKNQGGKNSYDIWFDRLRSTTGRGTIAAKISKFLVIHQRCVLFDEKGFERIYCIEFIPGVSGGSAPGLAAGGGFLLDSYDSPFVGMRLLCKESKARPVPHEFDGFSTYDIGKQPQLALLALRNAALDNADYFNLPMLEIDTDVVDPEWYRERVFKWKYGGTVPKRGQGRAVQPIFVPGNNLGEINTLIIQLRQHLQGLTAGEEILQGTLQGPQDNTAAQGAMRERNANVRLGESTSQSIESTLVWFVHFMRSAFIDFLSVPGEDGLSFSSPGGQLLLEQARLNPRLLLTDIKVDIPGLSGYDNAEIKKAAALARLNVLAKIFQNNMAAITEMVRQWLAADDTVSEDDRNKIVQAIQAETIQQIQNQRAALSQAGGFGPGGGAPEINGGGPAMRPPVRQALGG